MSVLQKSDVPVPINVAILWCSRAAYGSIPYEDLSTLSIFAQFWALNLIQEHHSEENTHVILS